MNLIIYYEMKNLYFVVVAEFLILLKIWHVDDFSDCNVLSEFIGPIYIKTCILKEEKLLKMMDGQIVVLASKSVTL